MISTNQDEDSFQCKACRRFFSIEGAKSYHGFEPDLCNECIEDNPLIAFFSATYLDFMAVVSKSMPNPFAQSDN